MYHCAQLFHAVLVVEVTSSGLHDKHQLSSSPAPCCIFHTTKWLQKSGATVGTSLPLLEQVISTVNDTGMGKIAKKAWRHNR